MTAYTTVTLLENVEYGQASGNYDGSSLLFYSDPVPAANYYGGNGAIQTIFYRLQDVQARLTVQASLNNETEQAHWFDVHTLSDDSTTHSGVYAFNVTGNFVWLRARVELFEAGIIDSITANY
jgi:hypothetical protein